MSQVVPFHDPENYRSVMIRIKQLWEKGNVIITFHARERMAERSIDILDIQHIIKYGRVVGHIIEKRRWKYELTNKLTDGRKASCVVVLEARAIIITVY